MKNFKNVIAIGTLILALGATSTSVFASSAYKTPAEAAAGVTGKTVQSVTAEKNETGKTYGTIAKNSGKLEEFKAANLELKKDNLDSQVASGTMTQEKADEILNSIKENQKTCDGTGSAKIGKTLGARFGSQGRGQGNGRGNGRGAGCGLGNGSCTQPNTAQ